VELEEAGMLGQLRVVVRGGFSDRNARRNTVKATRTSSSAAPGGRGAKGGTSGRRPVAAETEASKIPPGVRRRRLPQPFSPSPSALRRGGPLGAQELQSRPFSDSDRRAARRRRATDLHPARVRLLAFGGGLVVSILRAGPRWLRRKAVGKSARPGDMSLGRPRSRQRSP